MTGSYDAFISYSQRHDRTTARLLHRAIERLGKPWWKRRALTVFRDETDLSAHPELWAEIERRLARSTWLVVLASPAAAGSTWVDREIRWWLANRSARQILVVHTGGRIAWDDTAGDFDRGLSTAVPAALAGAFPAMPRWVEARELTRRLGGPGSDAMPGRHRDRSGGELVTTVAADVAATIHGRTKSELIGADLRQHRIARATASGAAALLVALAGGAAVAVRAAGRNDDRAAENARDAQAQSLTEAALQAMGGDVVLANLLAVAAYRLRPGPAQRAALLQSAAASPHLVRTHVADSDVTAVTGSATGTVTAGTADGSLLRWTPDDRPADVVRTGLGAVTTVETSADGAVAVAASETGAGLWWPGRNRWVTLPVEPGADVWAVAVSSAGDRAVVTRRLPAPSETRSGAAMISVYDTTSGAALATVQAVEPIRFVSVPDTPAGPVVRIQYRVDGGDTLTDELSLDRLVLIGHLGRRPFSPRTILRYSADGAFEVYNRMGAYGVRPTAGGGPGGATRGRAPSRQVGQFAVTDDGTRVAAAHDGTVHVLATELADPGVPESVALPGFPTVAALRFVSASRLLSAGQRTVSEWDLTQLSRITTRTAGHLVDRARFEQDPTVLTTPDGRLAVIADEVAHHAYVIDLDTGRQVHESPPPTGDGTSTVGTPLWTDATAERVVTASETAVSVWEPVTGRVIPLDWQRPAEAGPPIAVAARVVTGRAGAGSTGAGSAGAGELTAVYGDGSVRRHRADGTLIREVAPARTGATGQPGQVCGPTVTVDGATAAVFSAEPTVLTFVDVATGRQTAAPGEPTCVRPGPGGGFAVSYADGSVRLVGPGARTVPPVDAEAAPGWVVDAGRTMAVRLRPDGHLVVRDVSSGRQLGELAVPQPQSGIARDLSPYNSIRMVFRPDRPELLTVGSGADLLRWDLDVNRWLAVACRTAGRDLTPAEWRRFARADEAPRRLSCRG